MVAVVITIISRMVIFEKAGRSNVSAFIPFLNYYVLLRIVGMKKIGTLFYAMTLLNLYLSIRFLAPLLMPDEVMVNPFVRVLILPFFHPAHMGTLFITYWMLNAIYLGIHLRLHLRLAKLFGKSAGFGWGLAFLEPVFYPLLAFGRAEIKKN
jgi:hypothetical protein